MIVVGTPICLTCFGKARKALFSYKSRYDKAGLWLDHLRDAQVSVPQGPPGAQRCNTCRRVLTSVNFQQWQQLVRPQMAEDSE